MVTQPKASGVPRWVWGLAIAGGVIYAKARRQQGARERQLSVTPTFGGVVLRGRF